MRGGVSRCAGGQPQTLARSLRSATERVLCDITSQAVERKSELDLSRRVRTRPKRQRTSLP